MPIAKPMHAFAFLLAYPSTAGPLVIVLLLGAKAAGLRIDRKLVCLLAKSSLMGPLLAMKIAPSRRSLATSNSMTG
jgi:hypothetical protein